MKNQTELQSLQNAVNSSKIEGLNVYEKYTQDKRKTVKMFFLQMGTCSIGPVLDYSNMNHFILGFSKANDLINKKKNHFVLTIEGESVQIAIIKSESSPQSDKVEEAIKQHFDADGVKVYFSDTKDECIYSGDSVVNIGGETVDYEFTLTKCEVY